MQGGAGDKGLFRPTSHHSGLMWPKALDPHPDMPAGLRHGSRATCVEGAPGTLVPSLSVVSGGSLGSRGETG